MRYRDKVKLRSYSGPRELADLGANGHASLFRNRYTRGRGADACVMLTRDEHEAIARRVCFAGRRISVAHDRAFAAADLQYGAHGPVISGAGREHFPREVKDRLRRMAYAASYASTIARAHWYASGRREPTYRRLRAAAEAIYGRGFYG